MGFSEVYQQDLHVYIWVKYAAAVPFLAASEVQDARMEIVEDVPAIRHRSSSPYDKNLGRWPWTFLPWDLEPPSQPRFSHNHLEGWHSHRNKVVQRADPDIGAQGAEEIGEDHEKQVWQDPWRQLHKRTYSETDQSLTRLKDHVGAVLDTPLEFLTAAGHVVKISSWQRVCYCMSEISHEHNISNILYCLVQTGTWNGIFCNLKAFIFRHLPNLHTISLDICNEIEMIMKRHRYVWTH